jgi:hypothetical protein
VLESLAEHANASSASLDAAPRGWVRGLAIAMIVVLVGMVGAVVVAVLTGLSEPALARWMPGWDRDTILLLWLPVEVLVGVGTWALGSAEPGRRRAWDGPDVLRRACRGTAAAAGVWAVLLVLGMFAATRPVEFAHFTVARLLGAASAGFGFAYLAHLCGRMRRPTLASACVVVAWTLPTALVLRALSDLLGPGPSGPITAPEPLIGDVSLLVWYVQLMLDTRTMSIAVVAADPVALAVAGATLAGVVVLPIVAAGLVIVATARGRDD